MSSLGRMRRGSAKMVRCRQCGRGYMFRVEGPPCPICGHRGYR